MEIIINPEQNLWPKIIQRPVQDISGLSKNVEDILYEIKQNGQKALKKYTLQFDGIYMDSFGVKQEEFTYAEKQTDTDLKKAIKIAAKNIEKFHSAQKTEPIRIETSPGITCWQKAVPIEKVGLYIPGGTAPLFSTVLMLAIPANVAGCKEIVLCTPPDKEGKIHPAILYASIVARVNKIFKIGGIQAIGAMAYGINPVPKVNKIFGPGNQYVTAAKQIVSMNDVAIDMPAGPSEVMIVADNTAKAEFIAADLLSQAEHGGDSQVILITDSKKIAEKVAREINLQIEDIPRKKITEESLKNSMIIVMENIKETITLINTYAPEHLILSTTNYHKLADEVINAGSVFLGNYTPESAGDYASGTNHTLPTNGWARSYSGVNLDSFMKKITFQEISEKGLESIGPTIEIMAEAEHLTAHKNAVSVRIKDIKKNKMST
jgi:histidinol dehydrogenase